MDYDGLSGSGMSELQLKKNKQKNPTDNQKLPIEATWDALWVDPPKPPRCKSLPHLNVRTFRAG